MKTKKLLYKALSVLLFLSMLSFTSCEAFYCEKCTNGTDSVWECSQHTIEQLESQGYTCD